MPWHLIVKAVEANTGQKWVLLYVERWLKAPVQHPDGTLERRDRATPQGSPVSPLLANLFMHYGFDLWMVREFPTVPFERFCDDVVVHCVSEKQARYVRERIAARLGELGLRLHPDKTRIVFCEQAGREGSYEHTSFTFLGYDFRKRAARATGGGVFNGFLPGEYNELGGDFIVRASDAHSWVEAYFPGFNWISFDPTPPADEKAEGVFGFLALYWDWFELVWSEWVINYDFSHQVTLAQNLQRVSRDWAERARNFLIGAHRKGIDKLKEWQTQVIAAPHALPGFVAIVGAVILLFLLLFRGRAILAALAALWGLHVASHSVLTPRLATLLYQQMLRLLARRGIRKQPGQTPLEFASSVTAAELAAPVAQLTDLYQMARFGDHSAEAQKMGDLLASIKAIMRSPARST